MTLPRPDWPKFSQDEDAPRAPLQIWRLRLQDLPDDPLETLRPLTVPAEHARARQFRFEADQKRHLAGRGLLRALLAHRYKRPPRDLSLNEDSEGKPHVDDHSEETSAPHFNIAHAADAVVVALSWDQPVGIDIEPQDRIEDPEALAQRVCTETELRRLQSLPAADRAAFFLHIWTCKEAFLKATGTGLRRGPDTVECRFDGAMAAAIEDADGSEPDTPGPSASGWSLQAFQVTDDVIGTVVRKHDIPSPLFFADGRRLVKAQSPS